MNKKPSIKEVAECFIFLSRPGTKQSVNHRKLQMLTYYSQALSFAIRNDFLFNEDFEAWVHSPMSPILYYEYKKFRFDDIPKPPKMPCIDTEYFNIIKITWQMYGEKDDKYLENKTHRELPYRLARKDLDFHESSNEIISKDIMNRYYSRKFKVSVKTV